MTLLDAKVVRSGPGAPPQDQDPGRCRRHAYSGGGGVDESLLVGRSGWSDKFFAALQNKDYETAYGIYFADPQWKQHPDKYSRYPLNQFIQDWGPGGQWGIIKSYKVNGASTCSQWRQRSGGGCDRQ